MGSSSCSEVDARFQTQRSISGEALSVGRFVRFDHQLGASRTRPYLWDTGIVDL